MTPSFVGLFKLWILFAIFVLLSTAVDLGCVNLRGLLEQGPARHANQITGGYDRKAIALPPLKSPKASIC